MRGLVITLVAPTGQRVTLFANRPVPGGATATGVIRLDGPAPQGGMTVSIAPSYGGYSGQRSTTARVSATNGSAGAGNAALP